MSKLHAVHFVFDESEVSFVGETIVIRDRSTSSSTLLAQLHNTWASTANVDNTVCNRRTIRPCAADATNLVVLAKSGRLKAFARKHRLGITLPESAVQS